MAYLKSILIPTTEPLSDATWARYTDFTYNLTVPSGIFFWFWEIDAFGGSYGGRPTAIPALSADANAFGGRDGLLMFQLYVLAALRTGGFILMQMFSEGHTHRQMAATLRPVMPLRPLGHHL